MPQINIFSIISYVKQVVNRHISKRAKNNKRDEKAFKKFQDEEQIWLPSRGTGQAFRQILEGELDKNFAIIQAVGELDEYFFEKNLLCKENHHLKY